MSRSIEIFKLLVILPRVPFTYAILVFIACKTWKQMAPMATIPCVGSFCELADVATHNNYNTLSLLLFYKTHCGLAVTTAYVFFVRRLRRVLA